MFRPVLLLASVACLASAACAPLAGFRPASGIMDGRQAEVGLGGAALGPRPFVDEKTSGAAQFWASKRATKRLTVSGIGAVDLDALALGGALRVDALRTDRLALGAEGEGGFVWGAVSVPFAVRLFDETWVYTAPRLGTRGTDWLVELPAGVSVRVWDGLMIRPEYRATWVEALPEERRHVAGLGVAWQLR